MGDDKGKHLEDSTWVRRALSKEAKFDLEHAKENFMEAKKSFANASTSKSKVRLEPKVDPSMLTTFLETCMKLLHNSKAVKDWRNSLIDALGPRQENCT